MNISTRPLSAPLQHCFRTFGLCTGPSRPTMRSQTPNCEPPAVEVVITSPKLARSGDPRQVRTRKRLEGQQCAELILGHLRIIGVAVSFESCVIVAIHTPTPGKIFALLCDGFYCKQRLGDFQALNSHGSVHFHGVLIVQVLLSTVRTICSSRRYLETMYLLLHHAARKKHQVRNGQFGCNHCLQAAKI